MKTADKFLEELIVFINEKCSFDTVDRFLLGRQDTFQEIAIKIEQFQAEQKQVSDDR